MVHATQTDLILSAGFDDLVLRPAADDANVIEVIDPAADAWLLRLESLYEAPRGGNLPASPAAVSMVAALTRSLPELDKAVRDGMFLRVVFSPRVTLGLKTGRYVLMKSGGKTLTVARHAKSMQFVQHGRVVGGSAGSKAGMLGIAAATWPILLVTATTMAATLAQQAWLEDTLGRLEAALGRIEDRLRDDDHGALEAAEHLGYWLEPYLADGALPEQLRLELAASRQRVEAVYYARRRFVERFKHDLEQAQVQHERKKGKVNPWAGTVAEDLTKRESGALDELLIFLRAMVCRGRLTTATAAVLAADGEPQTACRMLDHLDGELRSDYHDLHNRIRALARVSPDAPLWQRVPLLSSTDLPGVSAVERQKAFAMVQQIEQVMHETVGSSLPARDALIEIILDADAVGEVLGESAEIA